MSATFTEHWAPIRLGDVARRRTWKQRLLTFLAIVGPGLIVTIGDNDAGGVATYASAGQNYGDSLLWVLVLLMPVLIVNQEMVLRLGAVAGVGHARLINERFGKFWGWFSVGDTFAEYGAATDSPDPDRIVHGRLETAAAGYTIMAGDLPSDMEYRPMAGSSVSLSGDAADLLRGYWEKLSTGGTITMPMQKQVWGDEFGMCVDKFGVSWMVNISQQQI